MEKKKLLQQGCYPSVYLFMFVDGSCELKFVRYAILFLNRMRRVGDV